MPTYTHETRDGSYLVEIDWTATFTKDSDYRGTFRELSSLEYLTIEVHDLDGDVHPVTEAELADLIGWREAERIEELIEEEALSMEIEAPEFDPLDNDWHGL